MSVPNPVKDGKAFEIFLDRTGYWCARRVDGLVFGLFVNRGAALRFVRMESLAVPASGE
jgi:hypothetical protein